MILKVGLTGGLASGKSTVAQILEGLGTKVIDADDVVDRLYEPGRPGHEALVREYGTEILDASGNVERKKLAALAFSSPEQAKRLNALIHPLVLEQEAATIRAEEERLRGSDGILVVEATLLLESGGRDRYDRIVIVDLDPSLQIERAVARGMDRADALRRMARQMPREERAALADYLIDNSGDESDLEIEARGLHARLEDDLARLSAAK